MLPLRKFSEGPSKFQRRERNFAESQIDRRDFACVGCQDVFMWNVVSTKRCLSAVCSISGALSIPALSTSARHLDQTDIFFCLEMLMDHTSCPPGWKWKCDERQFFSGDRKKWQALEPRWRGSPNFSQFDTWLPIVAKGRVANFSQFCNFTLCDIVLNHIDAIYCPSIWTTL